MRVLENIERISIYHAYWKIAESTVCRLVKKIENILIQGAKI